MPDTSKYFETRVHELRDERPQGNGWLVDLKPGWQLDGAHFFGEDRLTDIWPTLRRVTRCRCAECDPTDWSWLDKEDGRDWAVIVP